MFRSTHGVEVRRGRKAIVFYCPRTTGSARHRVGGFATRCVRMVVVEVVAIVLSALGSVVCGCEVDVWWMVVVVRWCAQFATSFAAVSR
eukprot:969556-Prymnesium_polylepis.1